MQREWGGIILMILVTILLWIYRTSTNGRRVLRQMRTLASELQKNAALLDTKRVAATESGATVALRRRQMEELREEGDMLRSEVRQLKVHCSALETKCNARELEQAELRSKLDEMIRIRTRLQKQLEEAHARELEIRARHGGDVLALNRLRTRSKPNIGFLPRSTDDSHSPSSELQDVAPPPPPRRLPKTPSETYLLSLQPNLSASDDDDDDIMNGASKEVAPPSTPTNSDVIARVSPTLARPSPPSRSNSARTPRSRRRRSGARSTDGSVSLSRAPWADTLPPLRHFSIANNEFDGVFARTVASNTHTSGSD